MNDKKTIGRRPLSMAVAGAGLILASAFLAPAADTPNAREFRSVVAPFLKQHCTECHGPEKQKGKLRLDNLSAERLNGPDARLWNAVRRRVLDGEMPPRSKPRPKAADTRLVLDYLAGELKKTGKLADASPAHRPSDGNKLNHDLLFGVKEFPPLDNPPRLWRLSPHIYATLASEVGKRRAKIAQPFSAAPGAGLKDYAAGGGIDEPTAAQLIRNATAIVAAQTDHTVENGRLKPRFGSYKEFIALMDPAQPPAKEQIEKAVRRQFQLVLQREPTDDELARHIALMEKNLKAGGPIHGVRTGLAAILLTPEAVFRLELGAGKPDDKGRVRLAPREIAYALAFALTDRRPDSTLLKAAESGELDSKEGVARQVERMLNDPKRPATRILRFFHEYFGYRAATDVFKDQKEFKDHEARVLVADTDRLIEDILAADKNVLVELLTTNKSYVNYGYDKKKKKVAPANKKNVHLSYNLDKWPSRQPVELPREERAGVITQPSWLVAHSLNTENHAILRGKWIRERLLGGTVPDLPITVDAQLPEDPTRSLRERMQVTRAEYCWQCHQRMNPLGLPFEMYDHFGRFRKTELDRPVDATGLVENSGDATLDGKVNSGLEMIKKLAKSERVRQVFVRHAFRFWMGRNENAGDARALMEADQAYVKSGGSMKALIASVLTSDSFLYRTVKEIRNKETRNPKSEIRNNKEPQFKIQKSQTKNNAASVGIRSYNGAVARLMNEGSPGCPKNRDVSLTIWKSGRTSSPGSRPSSRSCSERFAIRKMASNL